MELNKVGVTKYAKDHLLLGRVGTVANAYCL